MFRLSNENLEELNFAVSTVFAELSKLSNHEGIDDYYQIPIMKKIQAQMLQGKTLQFLLPAFPAKSPCPKKTSGIHPDLGEVLALSNLNEMCKKISSLYAPSAQVIICSDGRIFSDVVKVSDEDITTYLDSIKNIIIEFDLKYLSTFAMDDLYTDMTGTQLREQLVWQYAKSLEEVRSLVINDDNFQNLFNGVHRFLLEDQMSLEENSGLSKNQINKKTKELTYELLRRSDAWSTLLLEHFDDALRLSIHSYPLTHEKFGVKLVHSSKKWATPWHNVTVKKNDSFELMHLSEAQKVGAKQELFRGKYVYFQV